MHKTEWLRAMTEVNEYASFFRSSDVIDIEFDTGHKWEVYVAIDTASRSHGLRGVSELELDGMLFCYEVPNHGAFTMQGMSIDLDVAWFDENGTLIQSETFPKDHPYPLLCDKEFSYVLECKAGSFSNANLRLTNG